MSQMDGVHRIRTRISYCVKYGYYTRSMDERDYDKNDFTGFSCPLREAPMMYYATMVLSFTSPHVCLPQTVPRCTRHDAPVCRLCSCTCFHSLAPQAFAKMTCSARLKFDTNIRE